MGGEKCEIHNPTNRQDVRDEPTGDEICHYGAQNRAGGGQAQGAEIGYQIIRRADFQRIRNFGIPQKKGGRDMKQDDSRKILIFIKEKLEEWNEWISQASLACRDAEKEPLGLLYQDMVETLTCQMGIVLDGGVDTQEGFQEWHDARLKRWKQNLLRDNGIEWDALEREIARRKKIYEEQDYGQTV